MVKRGLAVVITIGFVSSLAAAGPEPDRADPVPRPTTRDALAAFAAGHSIVVEGLDRMGDEQGAIPDPQLSPARGLRSLLENYNFIATPRRDAGRRATGEDLPVRIVILGPNGPTRFTERLNVSRLDAGPPRSDTAPATQEQGSAPNGPRPPRPPTPPAQITAAGPAQPSPVPQPQSQINQQLTMVALTAASGGTATPSATANVPAGAQADIAALPAASADMAALTQSALQQVRSLTVALRHRPPQ